MRFVAMTICLCHGGYMRVLYPLLMAPNVQPPVGGKGRGGGGGVTG